MNVKIKIILAILLLSADVFAQVPPSIQWQQSFGGSSDEFANDIQLTFDGGYIVAGYSASDDGNVSGNHGGQDYWVVKLNAAGSLQWQHSYGGTYNDVATAVKQTSDSGYIVAGYSMSADGDITNHHGGIDTADYWVIKLDAGGTLQWQNSYGGSDYDAAASVQQTADSGYIAAGFTQSVDGDITLNHGNSDFWIVKLNAAGIIQWQQTYGGTSWDNAVSVRQTADGGYLAAGNTYSNNGDVSSNHGLSDYWLLKLTASGTIQWEKSYGGTDNDYPYNVIQTADGGYITAGLANSVDGDVMQHYAPPEFWIVKTDTMGIIQWQKSYGGQGSDAAYSIEQTADGGFIAAGITSSFDFDVTGNHGVNDCWVIKLDTTGNLQCELCYGGPWDDGATAIHQTADGGYIFTGHSMLTGGDVTTNYGAHDYWVVKLNAPSGINEITTNETLSVFPNPAMNEINVVTRNFTAGAAFSITDQSGKKVSAGMLKNKNAIINIRNLSAGVYIFQTGKQRQSFEIIRR